MDVVETAAATHGPCAWKRASAFFMEPWLGICSIFSVPQFSSPRQRPPSAAAGSATGPRRRHCHSPLQQWQSSFSDDRGTTASHSPPLFPSQAGSWWVQTPRYVPPSPNTHNTHPPLPPIMMTFATPVATLYTYNRKSRMNRPLSVHPRDASASPCLFVYSMCVFTYITCNPSELPAATLVAGDTCRTVMCFRGDGGWGWSRGTGEEGGMVVLRNWVSESGFGRGSFFGCCVGVELAGFADFDKFRFPTETTGWPLASLSGIRVGCWEQEGPARGR